jgi:hypothetical protein
VLRHSDRLPIYNSTMGRVFVWVVALCAAACGNVAVKPDARADAPGPDAFGCAADKLACSETCIDPMSDNMHCGDCETQCQSIGEMCQMGHCVETLKSCDELKMLTPTATSGFYALHDSTQIYCDMTTTPATTYAGVGIGQVDAAHTGWTLIKLTDLQNATMQNVFITLFNQKGGLELIEAWTDANCCFASEAVGTTLLMGGHINYPIPVGGANFECNVNHAAPLYTMQIQASPAVNATPPLAGNFFTTYPPTTNAQCSGAAKPSMFWKNFL